MGTFSAPKLVAALSSPSAESSPTATADLLEMYFQSDRVGRRGEYDIFVSTRPSPADPWGSPRMVAELSSSFTDESPEIAPDGLTLLFSSERNSNGYDIYVSTRASRSAAWSTPVVVPELSTPSNEQSPALSGSGRRLTLHSDRPGSQGKYDLFESVLGAGGKWSTPVPIVELNTTVYEGAPQLSSDDLVIYFDSNRPGGLGGWDIWTARRPSVSSPFGPATNVREVNGARTDDGTPWISADGRYLLFASTLNGDSDIWEARR
jgi:Tol biopolymer transport system component